MPHFREALLSSTLLGGALAVGVAGALAAPTAAAAQTRTETAAPSTPVSADDIIVTARKRNEQSIDVPITIRAVGSEELARRNIVDLRDVAASTPNLNVSPNAGSFGGSVALRGVGSGASGSSVVDQAVALVIDGVTATNGGAFRFAQFDLQQIEILNGPQSLYYGKNSTAGLISITSAEPTDTLRAMARIGYEFEGDRLLTEGFISGPLTDTLSARLALYRTHSQGYFVNTLPPGTVHPTYGVLRGPEYMRVPYGTDLAGRLSLKFEPNERLTIRFKGTAGQQTGSPAGFESQLFYCPRGTPQSRGTVAGVGDCVLDKRVVPYANPLTASAGLAQLGDGTPRLKLNQYLASLAVDYDLSGGLTLNSVTGLYKFRHREVTNAGYTTAGIVSNYTEMDKVDYSQEVRLSSDFDTPLNFMVGGFISTGSFDAFAPATLDIAGNGAPPPSNNGRWSVDTDVWSVFGQLTWQIADQFELSGGARYTNERKSATLTSSLTGPITLSRPSRTFKSVSPEATFSYKPNADTNIYVSYRTGIKSGNFNVGSFISQPTTQDYTFGDEKARGFEGGIKARLAPGLRTDLNLYSYKYTDLQVASFDPLTGITRLQNAASSTVKGVALTVNYAPPAVPGLSFMGAVNYNEARYSNYVGPCYTGQTVAQGCNRTLNAAGTAYLQQDYAGKPLVKAPDWTGSFQVAYDQNVGSGLKIGVSGGGNYSSSYYPIAEQPIQSLQRAYWLFDANLRIGAQNERWELALVGRNLTDKLRIQQAVGATLTPIVAANTGSLTLPGNMSDFAGFSNRPRTIELRLTVKY
ncbi:TonB-dependent receptor (plasmid) [Sphingobium sp. JS3065]|uniref:TonB-dependent receptor n=1 Tax=Sphingobium sp. JS3065 TaxID=2970925 RepID=UPI002263FE09|nr:TonB-dependent receptor [Sphingobium sp. JS3065]UZW58291.1 TonB-dependent receptor [Sphingobium sp. JS3065]